MVVALALTGWALPAHAAPEDIDLGGPPAAEFGIDACLGTNPNFGIGVIGAPGNVFWDFVNAPAPLTAGTVCAANTCNGVTVTLPAGSPGTSVPSNQEVTVTGVPTGPGSFGFRLIVTPEGGGAGQERDYEVTIASVYDVAFVLDRSGSMSGTTFVTPPAANRWDALKFGVNGFTPILAALSETCPGSRLALDLFATGVLANNSFPANAVNIDNAVANNLATELDSQQPSGATAMGAGLKAGIADLVDAARARVIVLFTDGEENQQPDVNDDGCGFSDGTTLNPTCPAGQGTIKVVTVGVGDPSDGYKTTLQNLAANNRGTAIFTSNGSTFRFGDGTGIPDVTSAFELAVQPALNGTSPQVVATFENVMLNDPNAPLTLPDFPINRKVGMVLVNLTFDKTTGPIIGITGAAAASSASSFLRTLVVRKDGVDVTKYVKVTSAGSTSNALLLSLRAGAGPEVLQLDGSYSIDLAPSARFDGPLGVRAVAYADDHRLDLQWSTSPSAPRAQQPFSPTVNLRWLGKPVTTAKVEAFILKPGDDLGDLLAKNPLKVEPTTGPDAPSPGHQKYTQLLQNDPDFLKKLLPTEQVLTLTHQSDGRYSASFNPGDIAGVYQILYRVSADDPKFGKLQRRMAQSAFVRPGPVDLAASVVSTTVNGQITTVVLKPITGYGRLLGPAQGSTITVTGGGAKLTSVVDNQDGSYVLTIEGDPGADVSVKIIDEEIYEGPVGGIGKGKGIFDRLHDLLAALGIPLWLFWLIVIGLLLLLILLVARRRSSP